MKTTRKLLLAFLILTCLNTYSQNINSLVSADSLKMEILNTLNNNKWYFYKGSIPEQPQSFKSFNISDKITIENHSLVFKTEKGTETINLILSEIEDWIVSLEWREEYIVFEIGDYYKIYKPNKFSNSGSKKQEKAEMNNNNEEVLKLHKTLLSFQKEVKYEFYNNELERFKTIIKGNDQNSEKQIISEEQRKYIVQANTLNEEKKYLSAITFYEKANAINPVSYPASYYNIALIASQTKNFEYAILNMKKYLMLVPNAEDARAAQDKIYEWEVKIGS